MTIGGTPQGVTSRIYVFKILRKHLRGFILIILCFRSFWFLFFYGDWDSELAGGSTGTAWRDLPRARLWLSLTSVPTNELVRNSPYDHPLLLDCSTGHKKTGQQMQPPYRPPSIRIKCCNERSHIHHPKPNILLPEAIVAKLRKRTGTRFDSNESRSWGVGSLAESSSLALLSKGDSPGNRWTLFCCISSIWVGAFLVFWWVAGGLLSPPQSSGNRSIRKKYPRCHTKRRELTTLREEIWRTTYWVLWVSGNELKWAYSYSPS